MLVQLLAWQILVFFLEIELSTLPFDATYNDHIFKAISLKPEVMMICDFVLALPSMASKQFYQSNFTHKVWVNSLHSFQVLLKNAVWWDCFTRLTLSRIYLFKKTTLMT